MSVVDELIDAVKELRDNTIFHGADSTECSVPDFFVWNVIQKLQKVESSKVKIVPGVPLCKQLQE